MCKYLEVGRVQLPWGTAVHSHQMMHFLKWDREPWSAGADPGFLAHLIDFYQMCYCCRKLDFFTDRPLRLGGRSVRPNLDSLIGSDRSVRESQPIRGARPPMGLPILALGVRIWAVGGRIRPSMASASHILSCDLSEPMRESKSVRPICEADLWGSWESEVRGADRLYRCEAMRLAVKSVGRPWGSDCIARCAWEADQPRPPTASHLGLSDRSHDFGLSRPPTQPHRSQIGLSNRSDYVTDLTDWFHSYLDRSDVP